ncbi:TMEM165/GDT1 family protein [Alkaliphilus hydrothermalis]|uniref:GDT1 family protein n=1 Tax=Alkaliphilus hydrothermalis TaxID=1482730 RepID=A0ABS2NRS5_9FIRM|nr:TMEM165/GDT1 family protein [Alkaliphilus hydrothermalis]MBM7615582.1 putative Ca2+/H+ antiporter (TMEM165/GDT1 family) [Alkaliphilus hydrothermalis]
MLRVIFTTFVIVFFAELGDKTQLQTMLLATQAKSVWPVFIGSSLALILSSFVGVIAATYINKFIDPHYLQMAAGVIFIIIGLLTLSGKI